MFQVLLGGLMNMMLFAMMIAGVAKLFSVHSELGEIKELLKEIKRNSDPENAPQYGRVPVQQLHHLNQAVQGYPAGPAPVVPAAVYPAGAGAAE